MEKIKIAYCNRPSYDNPLGGDAVQMLKTKEELEKLYNIQIDIITDPSLITKDYSRGIKIANKLECGGAVVNGASFFRSFEMPFGGWKHSGIGNEGVSSTLEEMSRVKTIVLKNIL